MRYWQEIVVAVAVLGAAIHILRASLRTLRPAKEGCSGGCGTACSSKPAQLIEIGPAALSSSTGPQSKTTDPESPR